MRTALTVAGSDSVGGAGLQADVKAMAALGIHAATVVTAVTAQNTQAVAEIFPMSADAVQAQLDAVLSDCDVRAAKTGMLYGAEIVGVVADAFEDHEAPLIVDPVMVATVGDRLCDGDYVRALKKKLLPMCELVTPNMREAEALTGIKIRNENDAVYACEIIGKEGSCVLLKGGHFDTKNVVDYYYLSAEIMRIRNPRLKQAAGHGSGCTLSAYIAANMANGLDLTTSVLEARKMIQQSIATQYTIGKGVPVVNTQVRLKNSNDDAKVKLIRELDSGVAKLLDVLPAGLIPPKGLNMAYAIKGARGPGEIAAVEGRIVRGNGKPARGGEVRFGAAEHMSFVLLEIMKTDPDIRCMMDLCATRDILENAKDAKMRIVEAERKGDISAAELTREALDSCKDSPDIIADVGKKESKEINILGRNPQEVLAKLQRIL